MTRQGESRLKRTASWLAVLVTAVVAAGTATAGTAAPATSASATASPQAATPPPPASTTAIQAALGVSGAVPAEIMFLVDESSSMSQHGMYDAILNDLPSYLGWLAAHEPQDNVDVITFGRMGSADHLYGGSPMADIGLPLVPDLGSTDFGQAFDLALTWLGRAPSDTRVGAVLLLSDGGLDAYGDPAYTTYQSPGWGELAFRAAHLRYPVDGYAVPLTGDEAFVTNQQQAFKAVWPKQQPKTLSANAANLGHQLTAIGDDVLASEVTDAAAKESNLGVQVTWSAMPAVGKPLNFRAPGSFGVRVTVTNLTQHIPLYLTDPHLTSPGLPLTINAAIPPVLSLGGGQSRTFPVRLAWQRQSAGFSLTGSSQTDSGHLVLDGTVGSPFTPTLISAYGDSSFSAGGLHDATSAPLIATTAATDLLMYLLLFLAALLLLAFLVLARALYRARLQGTLRLTTVDSLSKEYPLPRRLQTSVPTDQLIGIPGRLTVRGLMFNRDRKMRLKLELANRPSGDIELKPGGQGIAVGIHIAHSGRP